MNRESEICTFAAGDLRFVVDPELAKRRIEGRAIVYNVLSEDLGGFREKFAAGAVVLDPDLLALFDHQTSMVLGRISAGTLTASDAPGGVDMIAYPPDTTWARDMRMSMDRGDIKHMSFRFIPVEDEWDVVDDVVIRTITRAEVSELSVVSMPAYQQTSAVARSRAEALRQTSPARDIDPASAGGSPAAAAGHEGGSPERLFIAGGCLISLPDTQKGQ